MRVYTALCVIFFASAPMVAQDQGGLGLSAFEQGDYQKAATAFQQAIAHEPSFSHYINLGHCYLWLEQWEPAIQAYQGALALKSSDATVTVWRCLGQACFQAGRFDQAIEAFQQARLLEPNSSDTLWLAQALMAKQRWASAQALLASQLDGTPGQDDLLKLLAETYVHQKQWASAGTVLKELMVLNPDNSAHRLAYAQVQAQSGDYAEAHDTLAMTFRLDPTCQIQVRRLLADLQLIQNLPREAALCYARLLHQLDHPTAEDHYRLGIAYLKNKELSSAAQVFTRLQAVDPNDVRAPQFLAQIKRFQGDIAGAGHYYQQALGLAPDSPSIHLALATLAKQQGDHAQATTHFQRAIELGESSLDVFVQAVTAARQSRQIDHALTMLKRGLFHFPQSPELHAQLNLLIETE